MHLFRRRLGAPDNDLARVEFSCTAGERPGPASDSGSRLGRELAGVERVERCGVWVLPIDHR